MADLSSITAVRPTANTQVQLVAYGATVSAGQPVYLDTSDSEYKLADADASEAAAKAAGVAITPGVDGGYGLIAIGGDIILVGATMSVGDSYLVSATAGGIMPEGDLATDDYVTHLGRAETTGQLNLDIKAGGFQVP